MDGGASVSIQKVAANVSTERASFLLKGSSLDLRISEIVIATPVQQTSWQRPNEAGSTMPLRSNPPAIADGKKWTPYGRLTPAKIDLGGNEMAWSLVGNDGKVISYLVARDGGTLSQYEGQRISVLGATEQIGGRPMLRVTHIALP